VQKQYPNELQSIEPGDGFTPIRDLVQTFVIPSYARFDIAFIKGEGRYLFDINGKKYLDFASGIAVCCLGHAHPEIAETIARQAKTLTHVSNLYYIPQQGELARRLVHRIGPGKVFFCNSGAEANEGLFKLVRRYGHEEGRFEILTAINSFHGRTLAGISATGQEKVKRNFGPMVPGFRHVPFNNLKAIEEAISPATAAIMIEPIQGEGGIHPATPEFLIGLRELCNKYNLLLLFDEVQCGIYRTGRFLGYQTILEGQNPELIRAFLPDGVSLAKSLGNGFPIGAFWVRDKYADLLDPGSHASTYGGSPLACTVALKVLEIIERDNLPTHVRQIGSWLLTQLQRLAATYPSVIKDVRGVGLMLGIELLDKSEIPAFAALAKPSSIQFVNILHQHGLLAVPAGTCVVRLLPPINLTQQEAEEALTIIEQAIKSINKT